MLSTCFTCGEERLIPAMTASAKLRAATILLFFDKLDMVVTITSPIPIASRKPELKDNLRLL